MATLPLGRSRLASYQHAPLQHGHWQLPAMLLKPIPYLGRLRKTFRQPQPSKPQELKLSPQKQQCAEGSQ